ncbi:XdhC family protein [Geodermatophilus ruber]|uniref:Xanthine dehydrogenase accessory factor n=1 Tax=Geodermatophilus ruber TaxID=504800 RepID=A0A1I4GTX7_9ACTN|nr:XdhC family protein [Geodermatophilus ruber]SFL32913.1 xanthine dehydrogenase accessory factor [Geodermatophilus ruber]
MTVAERAEELVRSRVPFVHATVVRAQRPASAHAGDTAVIRSDGVIDGFVGGTCAESSVREYGLMALSTREPLLLRIVPGEQVPQASEEGAVTVANPCLSGGSVEIFLEPRVPAPRMLVVGDSPIAEALGALGGPLGFAVERVAGEDAAPSADDAALVVASHGQGEEPALTAALRLGVPYVGLIASRIRGAAVLAALDVTDEQRSRVRSPAGLDIGARTAGEIALSVLAQLVAERRAAERRPPPPARAVDPVCGMTVAAVGATPHVTLDGVSTWFCGPGCRTAFLADPAGHAPAS